MLTCETLDFTLTAIDVQLVLDDRSAILSRFNCDSATP